MVGGAAWRIGVDEAGYGPNLGPLVVAATAWRVPLADRSAPLEDLLDDAVTRSPGGDSRLLIADSKAVYQPGGGLAKLEHAVLAALGKPVSWGEMIDHLAADPGGRLNEAPWRVEFNPSLPVDADPRDVAQGAKLLESAREHSSVGPPRLAARLVFPAEFNKLVAEHGTKGAALSNVSLTLARRLYDATALSTNEPADFTFDKHGGRNRYGALVQEHFPEAWIETLEEARPASRYRGGDRLTFCFRSKGEEELPVALASMTAKLMREIAMKGFNAFWSEQVPGLKPTAGYPVDAKRFKADIAAKQAELGVEDRMLWRSR